MAKISFADQHTFFDWRSNLFPPGSTDSSGSDKVWFTQESPTQWLYQLTAGGPLTVIVKGEGLQYSSPYPTGGVVKSVTFSNFNNVTGETSKVVISGLNADFARLNWSNSASWDSFTQLMLEGDDTVDFGSNASDNGFNYFFYADGLSGGVYGGNDTLRGDAGIDAELSGDIYRVVGGFLRYGGDDDIRLTGWRTGATVVGDALFVDEIGVMVGGDDYISLRASGKASGDVESAFGNIVGGDDTLIGSSGADQLTGDAWSTFSSSTSKGGDDSIRGGKGNDKIYGDVKDNESPYYRGGNDKLYGEDGKDTIAGGGGEDSLLGGTGNDSMEGNSGNDWLRGEDGLDTLKGGSGIDTADYSDKTVKVTITYASGTTNVTVAGAVEDKLSDIENINGGSAGDRIDGALVEMNNKFEGGGGNDTLFGGFGDDTLIGGAGKDTLEGGGDSDQFRFTLKPSASNIDTILDFKHGTDKIALSAAIFAALGTGVGEDEFGAKASGHAASDKQHIIYNKADGTLWYDYDDNSSGAAVQIAQLGTAANHPTDLTYKDFIIV